MATSLISTGLKFPDDTVQTTAATAGGGSIEAVASGSLSNGSKVVINTDGTVSVISATANPQTVGTPVVFESASTDQMLYKAATFDSANNKVVIAYQDEGNSNFGTAIVGTVSGTTISFGTAVVFESAETLSIQSCYDVANNKIVITYRDGGNSFFGTVIVGTVSGTSISFGTAVVYASANAVGSPLHDSVNNKIVVAYQDASASNFGKAVVGTVAGTSISFGTAVVFLSGGVNFVNSVFDAFSQKTVIAVRNLSNSSFGTAFVGTVSGTSISFGGGVVFESATTTEISTAFDSTNNKIIIAYSDAGNSSFGTAIVGTVSGTSISFGTPVVFESADSKFTSTTFDTNSNKVVIGYQDNGNSGFGTAVVGTVSGTSISFGTPVVFEGAFTQFISTTFDSVSNKVVIAYQDFSNSKHGTAVVFQNESTNLTSENYIGISDGAYSDTATATIQVAGAVDDAQSGLTAGQAYYVQPDGALSTTAGTPEVFAGTAVSSTKLIVKG